MIGRNISHFYITESLGEGGMGRVFKATDRRLQRTVAIKMLNPQLLNDSASFQRFQNEAKLSGRITHPNVAALYDFQTEGDHHFIVMEYVNGMPLDKLLSLRGKLPAQTTAKIALQVLEGLEAAHELGITHRDLKPGNIMVTNRGYVKLMDFGIARLENSDRLTRHNHVIGTLEYMAPELIKGEAPSKCSDLYALGVMLHEMLTGKTPFAGGTEASLLYQITQGQYKLDLKDTDRKLAQVIKKLMHRQPARRYQTTQEVIQAIEKSYASGKINTTLLTNSSPTPEDSSTGFPVSLPAIPSQVSLPKIGLPTFLKDLNLDIDRRIIGAAALLCLIILITGMFKSNPSDSPHPSTDPLETPSSLSSASREKPASTQFSPAPVESPRPRQLPQGPQQLPSPETNDPTAKKTAPKSREKVQKTEQQHVIKRVNNEESTREKSSNREANADPKSTENTQQTDAEREVRKEERQTIKEDVIPEEPEPAPEEPATATRFIRFPDLSVSAQLAETISTQTNQQGQTIYLTTTKATYFANTLIIAKGAKIRGEIRKLRKGRGGKRAFLSIKLKGIETAAGTWLPVSYPEYSDLGKLEVAFEKGLIINNIKIKSHALSFPQNN